MQISMNTNSINPQQTSSLATNLHAFMSWFLLFLELFIMKNVRTSILWADFQTNAVKYGEVGKYTVCITIMLICLLPSLNNNNNNKNNNNNTNHIQMHILRFLQSPHCAANCLQHICSSGPGTMVCRSHATHRALITCSVQSVTWYGGTTQLLSLTEFKLHLLFRLISLAEPINRWSAHIVYTGWITTMSICLLPSLNINIHIKYTGSITTMSICLLVLPSLNINIHIKYTGWITTMSICWLPSLNINIHIKCTCWFTTLNNLPHRFSVQPLCTALQVQDRPAVTPV